ncbi:MAG: hypothetical protein RLZZ15_636 [Verrucomicrobiota bacterium]|jgi:hypothetical protein
MNDRPKSLREIAARAEDLDHFGREFADWLHTLRTLHTRAALARSIAEEPEMLASRFSAGHISDAWLAAYAEYLAERVGRRPPVWCASPRRIAREPWFSTDRPLSRALALRDSPPAFKNRNLFTSRVDLPLRLRAGRPEKTADEKRLANAARQRRFRQRRALELHLLRETGDLLAR